MVGAVAGTPGTGPTNWVNQQLVGLSRQISLGTENGLSYIDLRFFGTGNANDNLRIDLEGLTQIAAANGQTWAYSLYAKAISGTIPTASFIFLERNIAGSSVTVGGSSFTPTSTLTRFNSIRTLNGGVTVAFVQPSLFFAIVSGATYDFTIRIAAPQMELGTYATTFIRTTTAAVTRLADAFSRSNVYTNGFITSAGGTWFIDLSENLSLQRDSGGAGLFLSTDGNGITNSFNVRAPGGLNRLNIAKYVSGSLTGLFNTTTTKVKIAIKWNGATADIFVNGTKQVSATNFTATQLEFLNQASTGVVKYIDDMALFRAPLTDAQCIQLTTL
jgi:hypothetical protein